MARFIQLALVAAAQAIEDAGWFPESEADRWATGVMIGSGFGGPVDVTYDAAVQVHRGRASSLAVLWCLGAHRSGGGAESLHGMD